MRIILPLFLLLVLPVAPLEAADFGDKAPPLKVAEWTVNDAPAAEAKGVRVILFWATWFPHSPSILRHFSELQQKYADGVEIVALSKEKADLVREFVKDARLSVAIGIDAGGATHAAYLGDEAQLPVAFVIDKTGVVQWRGNPMQGIDNIIRKVRAGTYSPEAAQRVQQLQQQLRQARGPEEAFALLDQIIETEPDNHEHHTVYAMLLMQTRSLERLPAAYTAWARGCQHNPDGLAALSMFLVRQTDLQIKNPALALQAATRAFALSKGRNPEVVVALARAVADTGAIERAVLVLQRAIDQKIDTPGIRGTLQYYSSLLRFRKEVDSILEGKPSPAPPATE